MCVFFPQKGFPEAEGEPPELIGKGLPLCELCHLLLPASIRAVWSPARDSQRHLVTVPSITWENNHAAHDQLGLNIKK